MRSPKPTRLISALIATVLVLYPLASHAAASQRPGTPGIEASPKEQIAPFQPRFGRLRPVIAVIGENSGTEMTDFVIPYSILTEAAAGEVLALSVKPGTVTMRPTSLQLVPQATVAQFDVNYPDGADYVIVPAVAVQSEPLLLAWISAQAAKGATLVSICDGALVLARAGLMKGKRGTAHWYTHQMREQQYPETSWHKNTRYVADGRIVSSAGISAALPTSLALVEAIAGRERALAIGARYGISEWGSQHNSDRFVPAFGRNLTGHITTKYANRWLHSAETVGVPVHSGIEDISLALTMDSYSRTGRSRALAMAPDKLPFMTRNGLTFLPDRVAGGVNPPQRILKPLEQAPVAGLFERVLGNIDADYGRNTGDGVAYDFEYRRVEN